MISDLYQVEDFRKGEVRTYALVLFQKWIPDTLLIQILFDEWIMRWTDKGLVKVIRKDLFLVDCDIMDIFDDRMLALENEIMNKILDKNEWRKEYFSKLNA